MPDTMQVLPYLTADQIRIVLDWAYRDVILVPDEVAREINRQVNDGWREYVSDAWGESRPFRVGTWMFQVVHTLMAAFAASDVHDSLTGKDRTRAVGERLAAAERWHLWPRIVSVSDWGHEARTWRDRSASHDLHVRGTPSACVNDNAFQFAG
ncbi:hypothetical protein [Actinoplanes sp. NPDC049118]|uniref:hypothetical protein n=1 Tax=Actinoplanes sp. NPDC049118 TaxID=3155769 RepID=UPI0033CCE5E6